MTDQKHCSVCGIPTTQRCSRCKSTYYCSPNHINQDWPSHKKMCRANPGSETIGIPTVTAVLFPINEETPRLVQVEYKVNEVGDEINHDLNLKPWFNTAPYPHWIDRTNGQTGRPLGRTLSMIFNDNFIMSHDPLNQSIERNVPGGPGKRWCGNVLVFRAREPIWKYAQFDNATINNIKPTLRYLRNYGRMRY